MTSFKDTVVLKTSRTSRSTLLDELVDNYVHAYIIYNSSDSREEDSEAAMLNSIATCLKKLDVFSEYNNLTRYGLWNSWLHWVERVGETHVDLSKHSMSCCHAGILWQFAEVAENPSSRAVESLRSRLSTFMKLCQEKLSSVSVLDEEAFTCICDMLIVFSNQLGKNPQLANLVYCPHKDLQLQLSTFIQMKVFVSSNGDNEGGNDREGLHRRRTFLSAFCKLIIYSVIDVSFAVDILKNFVKFRQEYGDIINFTLGRIFKMNGVNCAKIVIICLVKVFKDCIASLPHEDVDRKGDSFLHLKNLAKRFASSFHKYKIKNRDAIMALHQQGIRFSCDSSRARGIRDVTDAPSRIVFLQILSKFSNVLTKQDKNTVLKYFERKLFHVPPSFYDDANINSVTIYLRSLG